MATVRPLPGLSPKWGPEAFALAEQARVLSGTKLARLVRRLQRHTGHTQQECWHFVIKYGIKAEVDHRRWNEEELDEALELLTKYPVEEVAKRLNRSPKAVRNALQRRQLSVREIRCDCFSLVALARALHVRRTEVLHWIEQGWLQATVTTHGDRNTYRITPEALATLYKHHLHDLLKRRIPNLSLFEAYVQYCFSPKHTTGEQLLEVRRDKRESKRLPRYKTESPALSRARQMKMTLSSPEHPMPRHTRRSFAGHFQREHVRPNTAAHVLTWKMPTCRSSARWAPGRLPILPVKIVLLFISGQEHYLDTSALIIRSRRGSHPGLRLDLHITVDGAEWLTIRSVSRDEPFAKA